MNLAHSCFIVLSFLIGMAFIFSGIFIRSVENDRIKTVCIINQHYITPSICDGYNFSGIVEYGYNTTFGYQNKNITSVCSNYPNYIQNRLDHKYPIDKRVECWYNSDNLYFITYFGGIIAIVIGSIFIALSLIFLVIAVYKIVHKYKPIRILKYTEYDKL